MMGMEVKDTLRTGLFFQECDVTEIRKRIHDPRYAHVWSSIRETAQCVANARSLVLEDDTMTEWYYVRNRLMDLSLSVLLEKDATQAEVLNIILADLCGRDTDFWQGPCYPNRPRTVVYHGAEVPVGELETAQLAMGICTAYDWAYGLLDDAVKLKVENTLRTVALPLLRNSVRFQSENWVMNHLCVISAGMALTALVLGEEEKSFCEDIGLAERGLNLWMEKIEADGSYGESYHYWAYPVNCLFFGLSALRHVLGHELKNTYRLRRAMHWAVNNQVGKYTIEGYDGLVSVAVNNYDCPFLFQMEAPEVLLFTRFFGDPLGQWYIEKFLLPDPPRPDCLHHVWHRCNSILLALDDRKLASRSPDKLGLPTASYFADTGFVYMRDGWQKCGEPDGDTVLSLQSGGGGRSSSHEHYDKNSISLYSHGEYLICDPGHSCYRGASHKTYDTSTVGHNTLCIGGENQNLAFLERGMLFDEAKERRSFHNQAYLVGKNFGDDVAYVASEARRCYSPYLKNFLRRVWFVRPDYFIIWDRIDASNHDKPADIGFNINNYDGRTKIDIRGSMIDVERPKALMQIHFLFPQVLSFEKSPAKLHMAYHTLPDQKVEGKEGSAIRITPRTPGTNKNKVDYIYVITPFSVGGKPVSATVEELVTIGGSWIDSMSFSIIRGSKTNRFVLSGEDVILSEDGKELYRY